MHCAIFLTQIRQPCCILLLRHGCVPGSRGQELLGASSLEVTSSSSYQNAARFAETVMQRTHARRISWVAAMFASASLFNSPLSFEDFFWGQESYYLVVKGGGLMQLGSRVARRSAAAAQGTCSTILWISISLLPTRMPVECFCFLRMQGRPFGIQLLGAYAFEAVQSILFRTRWSSRRAQSRARRPRRT